MVDVRTRSSTETKQNIAHPWQNGFSSSRHPELLLLYAWCGSFGSGAKATDEARASTTKQGFNPITRKKKQKKEHRPFPAIEFGTSVGSLREVFEYWIFLYKLEITI